MTFAAIPVPYEPFLEQNSFKTGQNGPGMAKNKKSKAREGLSELPKRKNDGPELGECSQAMKSDQKSR